MDKINLEKFVPENIDPKIISEAVKGEGLRKSLEESGYLKMRTRARELLGGSEATDDVADNLIYQMTTMGTVGREIERLKDGSKNYTEVYGKAELDIGWSRESNYYTDEYCEIDENNLETKFKTIVLGDSERLQLGNRINKVMDHYRFIDGERITNASGIEAGLLAEIGECDDETARDMGRLWNLVVIANNNPDTYFGQRLIKYLESDGDPKNLPNVLADLMVENIARFRGYERFWGPVLEDFNSKYVPVMKETYGEKGYDYGQEVGAEDIVWFFGNEMGEKTFGAVTMADYPLEGNQGKYMGVVIDRNIPNSEAMPHKIGYRFDGKLIEVVDTVTHVPCDGKKSSEKKTAILHMLGHEAIHARGRQQRGNLPDPTSRADFRFLVESMTEIFTQDVDKRVRESSPELFYEDKFVRDYSVETLIVRNTAELLNMSTEELWTPAIEQDIFGFIDTFNNKISELSDVDYRGFVDGLYKQMRIGPSQRDKMLTDRTNSVMDVFKMSRIWTGLAIQSRFSGFVPPGGFEWLKQQSEDENSMAAKMAPRELFNNFDEFMRYQEESLKLKEKPDYLPEVYFSNTEAGRLVENFGETWTGRLHEHTKGFMQRVKEPEEVV